MLEVCPKQKRSSEQMGKLAIHRQACHPRTYSSRNLHCEPLEIVYELIKVTSDGELCGLHTVESVTVNYQSEHSQKLEFLI